MDDLLADAGFDAAGGAASRRSFALSAMSSAEADSFSDASQYWSKMPRCCGASGSAILEPDLGRGLDSDDLSLVDLDEDGAVLDGPQGISHRGDHGLLHVSSTVARVSRVWVTHALDTLTGVS